MGERQSWHTYIPYTDRIDYLSGVENNFPYVLAVETLAGIEVPDRAKVIRIMLAELFRIISHLVFLGTFAQDLGMMSPVFYMFTDRERRSVSWKRSPGRACIRGGFASAGWRRICRMGWETLVRDFLGYMQGRLANMKKWCCATAFSKRARAGSAALAQSKPSRGGQPGRCCAPRAMPGISASSDPMAAMNSSISTFPPASAATATTARRCTWRRWRKACASSNNASQHMPAGLYKSKHPLTTPPLKEDTLYAIETLIDHFVHVSWGPVIPAGEACFGTEAPKGNNSYYLISDGNTIAYRTRIRTPSFAHMQMLPLLTRGRMIPDLIAILGSLDFVLADIDR